MNEYSPVEPDCSRGPVPRVRRTPRRVPGPPHRRMGRPLWSVSRAADVHAVLTDPGAVVEQEGTRSREHVERCRRHAARRPARARRSAASSPGDWFAPPAVARLEPSAALADRVDLVDGSKALARADLYADVALPVPVTSFCAIVGVDIADRDRFVDWADELIVVDGVPGAQGSIARRELRAFTTAEVERRRSGGGHRRARPGRTPVATSPPTPYSRRQRMPLARSSNMVNQLLIAGHETTTSLITNCVWRLLEERGHQVAAARRRSALVPNAVEESLRFDPAGARPLPDQQRRHGDPRRRHPRRTRR